MTAINNVKDFDFIVVGGTSLIYGLSNASTVI